MNAQLQSWHNAVDLVPHVVFLLDDQCRIIRSNRTAERWKLGAADSLAGLRLHDALHQNCSEPCCYLSEFQQHAAHVLRFGGCVSHDAWDAVLNRQLMVRIQRAAAHDDAWPEQACAVATIDDLTAARNADLGASTACSTGMEPAHDVPYSTSPHALSALDRVSTAVAMADSHGQVSYLNPVARTLIPLRVAGQEARGGAPRGTDLRRIVPPAGIEEAQRNGSWTGLCVIATDDGRTLERMLTLAAFRDEAGRLRGYTLVDAPAETACTLECRDIGEAGARYLAAQQLAIQESERRRIAADLHDGLGQSLALLKRSVEEAAGALDAGSYETLGNRLAQLSTKTQSALSEVRRIAMNLRPSILDDLGIVATLSWFCREFEMSYPEIRLERNVRVRESEVLDAVKTAVFRILQEATNNAVKYSGASRIRMEFAEVRGELRLTIADNGGGFKTVARADADPMAPPGLGLKTMKERAELTGGRCEMKSVPGEGVTIEVRWPSKRHQRRYIAALPRRTMRVIPTPRPAKRLQDDVGGASRPAWLD